PPSPSDVEVCPSPVPTPTSGRGPIPRAVILGDSYAEALRPFLAEAFQHAIYDIRLGSTDGHKGYRLDRQLIEREQPNVVIQEILESNLTLLGRTPAPLRGLSSQSCLTPASTRRPPETEPAEDPKPAVLLA